MTDEDQPAPRRLSPRTVTAGAAAVVLLAATLGFVAVNQYSTQVRQADVFGPIDDSTRPADGPGTNILVAGTDRRTGLEQEDLRALHVGTGDYGPARPDSLMLVHVAEDGRGVSVVSLPRESYLEIPSYVTKKGVVQTARKNRLNAAYELGGPPLLIRTVEQATGIRIDHYAEVDYAGFLSTVDALGGVPVCSTKAVKDAKSGLDLPAGSTVVNGTQALAYVRARSLDTEFGRMLRQQKFLSSIVQKVTSAGTLLNPFALNSFLDTAMSSVTTDPGFGRDEMLALGNTLRSVDARDIVFLTVPVAKANYRVDIGKLRNQSTVLWSDDAKDLFARLGKDQPLVSSGDDPGDAAEVRVAPSRLRVKVYNAAGTSGLGRTVADALAKEGYQVVGQPLNAKTQGAQTTTIEFDPRFNDSLRTLTAAFPNATTKPVRGLGNTFVLQVGTDYAGVRPVTVTTTAGGGSGAINSPTKVHTAADSICA